MRACNPLNVAVVLKVPTSSSTWYSTLILIVVVPLALFGCILFSLLSIGSKLRLFRLATCYTKRATSWLAQQMPQLVVIQRGCKSRATPCFLTH